MSLQQTMTRNIKGNVVSSTPPLVALSPGLEEKDVEFSLPQPVMIPERSTPFHSTTPSFVSRDNETRSTSATKHPGEKKFCCTFPGCNIKYRKSSHLKCHFRRHSGEKPYSCTWQDCEWKFCRSDELARHLRSHKGIKPYPCTVCLRAFSRPEHLAKHSRGHVREKEDEQQQVRDAAEAVCSLFKPSHA